MLCVEGYHRATEIRRAVEGCVLSWSRRIRPARKDLSKSIYGILRVGWDRVAVLIELESAVDIEFVQADREQLQYFPAIVLVRPASLAAVVVHHVEAIAHAGIQRNVV